MLKAAKETSRDEEVLKVQWQSVVEQAKTDMRKVGSKDCCNLHVHDCLFYFGFCCYFSNQRFIPYYSAIFPILYRNILWRQGKIRLPLT